MTPLSEDWAAMSESGLIDGLSKSLASLAAGEVPVVRAELELRRRHLEATHDLIAATNELRVSSDRAARRLLFATWILVGVTVALVLLTLALIITGCPRGTKSGTNRASLASG